MKRHIVVVPVVAAAFVLAGCNSGNTGTPEPSTSSGNGGGSPSSSSNGTSGIADLKPCSLLSSSDLSQNGLTKNKSGTEGDARYCRWENTTADQGNGYALDVGIRDHQGIGSINTNGYTVTSIGSISGHQAKQAEGATGCFVSLAVGSSSRVDVQVAGDPSTECQLANQYAKLVAPNLPNG